MAEARSDGAGSIRPQPGPERLERTVDTPEGVALSMMLASRGDRAIAFLLDAVFMFLVLLALLVALLALASVPDTGDILVSFGLIAFFLLRNFYFIYFEIRRAGQTPGKRIVGIKVIDRKGGPLRADAVIARNLTREIEIFLPLTFLAGGGGLLDNDIARIAALVWVGIFALMPLFNRDNLRVGDMVGGTWVVATPKVMLLSDLTEAAATPAVEPARQFVAGQQLRPTEARTHTFTDAQLDIYGIYELQTLEDVLRRHDSEETRALVAEVAERIRTKIGWNGTVPESKARGFLQDFYQALRQRLETRMLFGERRERKRDEE